MGLNGLKVSRREYVYGCHTMEFWRKNSQTSRHLSTRSTLIEICGIGLVSGGGTEAPALSFSGLCGVINVSQLVAIGVSDVSAVEPFAVMRTLARCSLVSATVI